MMTEQETANAGERGAGIGIATTAAAVVVIPTKRFRTPVRRRLDSWKSR